MADVVSLGVDRHRRGWVGVVLPPSNPAVVVEDPALEVLIARVAEADCVERASQAVVPASARACSSVRSASKRLRSRRRFPRGKSFEVKGSAASRTWGT